MKLFFCLILLLTSTISFGQIQNKDSVIIEFANTYGQLRHFYPHQIKSSQWHNFLYSSIQMIDSQENYHDIFTKNISPNFKNVTLSEELINPVKKQFQTPVYWQHLGNGKSDGNFYKSILVNYDSLSYLENGFYIGKRIENDFDSIIINIQCNEKNNDYGNVQLSLLSYGWVTGQQNISNLKLPQPSSNSDISSTLFNYAISNVYFKLYFIIKDKIEILVKSVDIVGYKNGGATTVLHHKFNGSLPPSEISIGDHHSTEISNNEDGLKITCTDPQKLKQLFPGNLSETGTGTFESQLSTNLFLSVPLVIDKSEIIKTLPFPKFLTEDFPKIAKSALIETYCRIKFFDPNLRFVKLDLDSLLVSLYHKADNCKSIYETRDLLNTFLVPLHDGHANVYNFDVKPTNKCLNFDVTFVGNRCFVIRSENEKFSTGDEILKINNLDPNIYLKSKIVEEQGSFQKEKQNAELYLMCQDSTMNFDITYIHKNKKTNYQNLPKNESAIGIWSASKEPIKEVDKDIYLLDLYYVEESEVMKLIEQNQNIRGIILDARKGIRVEEKILTYLTKDSLFYPIVKMPMYSLPNQENAIFKDYNVNAFKTGVSNSNVPTVLITNPRNISTEETFVSMAIQIPTCTTIGEYTGGCNGVYNTFYTIGGFEITYTGTIVNKINGDQLYNIGYQPDILITNTRKSIKKNQDLPVKKAIKKIKRV